MKRISLLVALLVAVASIADAQTAKKKTTKPTKKVVAQKKAAPAAKKFISLEMLILNEDSSVRFEKLNPGDKLVYEVNANGDKYDFIVTLNTETMDGGIDFNYEMTNAANSKGHVVISRNAKRESKSYINFFRGGELSLTDACTVWMTNANFRDMPAKKTDIVLDGAAPETFYRTDNDAVRPEIIFRGQKAAVDGFMINNAADMSGDKTWWIQNTSANSLILKMDLGWTVQLKEIK